MATASSLHTEPQPTTAAMSATSTRLDIGLHEEVRGGRQMKLRTREQEETHTHGANGKGHGPEEIRIHTTKWRNTLHPKSNRRRVSMRCTHHVVMTDTIKETMTNMHFTLFHVLRAGSPKRASARGLGRTICLQRWPHATSTHKVTHTNKKQRGTEVTKTQPGSSC